jgi:Family of unknown function (DUF6491)
MAGTLRFGMAALSCAAGLVMAICAPAFADDNAPASGDQPQLTPRPFPSGINCVWRPQLRSGYFSVIDDSHIVIEGDNRKYYLITLTHRCFDIDTNFQLAFTARGDQLCGPGDSIITKRERCPIQYLEEVGSYSDGKSVVALRDAAAKAKRQAN